MQKDTVALISLGSFWPTSGRQLPSPQHWLEVTAHGSFQVRKRSGMESPEDRTLQGRTVPVKDSWCRAVERTWVSEEWSRFLALRLQEKELSQREQVLFQLKYIHDGVVQLSQHHKVDRKAGSTVLGGWIAREPRQGVVLLQNKS